jgi:pimeloyl-ACP methyl ester carboxylesterase
MHLDLQDLRIEYQEAGAGPRTMLLLHGNFGSWRWWRQVLDSPPIGTRVIAPFMRGCGGTRNLGGGYRMERLAADAKALLDALDVPQVTLVGHSLGAAIALEFARLWPERVDQLVLVAPPPGDALESFRGRNDAMGQLMTWFDPRCPLSGPALYTALVMGRLYGTHRPELERSLAKMMPFADRAAVGFEQLVEDASTMDLHAAVGIYDALAKWDLRPSRAHIHVPVEVLAGRHDVLLPLPTLEPLVQGLPDARLTVWEDAGHAPHVEHSQRFVQWLERVTQVYLPRVSAVG